MYNNTFNFGVESSTFAGFLNDIDTSNEVNGKPIYYWINENDKRVPLDAGYVALINCTKIMVKDLTLSNNIHGIIVAGSTNITIQNVTLINNFDGIYMRGSMYACMHTINNFLTHNIIANNTGSGIRLYTADANIISDNNITSNNIGITLWYSSNNVFYHNNLINNIRQVHFHHGTWENTWDNGYPSGGNYWSDYAGVDFYSGPYQNETGSDGIGDTPYVIDEYNVDHYPLIKPWTPTPLVVNATIDIYPQSLNLMSKGRGRWITVYIELPENYNVADINVSTLMLNDIISAELRPTATGDYDNDTIPDLMVKFDRTEVISYILANVNMTELIEKRFITVTLTITGKLYNGTPFQGSDTIRIIMPMPRGLYKIFPI